ncbi:MAG: flagellar basal body-associated FliL family protein [Gammaproteobacteria bacterium]
MQKLILCATILLLGLTQAQAANDNEVASKSSAYVSLSEPMVLNLSGGKRLTFLQISADVLVSDADAESKIKTHVPAIQHSLIMLLSEQKAGDIKSPTKREEIRQQASARVKGLMAELADSQDVSEALFSSILVQ